MNFKEFLLEVRLEDLGNMDLPQLQNAYRAIQVQKQAPRLSSEKLSELKRIEEFIWRAIKYKEKNPEGRTVVYNAIGNQPIAQAADPKPTLQDPLHTWRLYYTNRSNEVMGAITKLKELDRKTHDRQTSLRIYEIIKYLRNLSRAAG